MPITANQHPGRNRTFLKKYVRERSNPGRFVERMAIDGYRWLVKRDSGLTPEWIRKILSHHKRIDQQDPDCLKTDVKRCLSRFSENGFSCVVKEFIPLPWHPMVSDRRSWRSAAGVECYGLPGVHYVAWGRKRGRPSYVIMQDVGARNLSLELVRLAQERDWRRFARVLEAVAVLVANMHLLGVYHRDLKVPNFMWVNAPDEPIDLRLIDLDAVSFYRRLPLQKRANNIQQFTCSLPRNTPFPLMLRCLATYRQAADLPKVTLVKALSLLDTGDERLSRWEKTYRSI